ncbi:hypothetical protein R3P38DRAFT_3397014 [Favolaschia claudopus]|uniref:Uncharacterized protein n=1 Tax=Favolaschia claudopus TaxID=2862362 RepID=A0AAW0B7H1_9AGAR
MFSHSDHHHVASPIPAQGATTAFLSSTPAISTPDRASSHLCRLETLLESALATLTLIHDIGTIHYPDHILDLIGAVQRRITAHIPDTAPSDPNDASSPPPKPSSDVLSHPPDKDKETKTDHMTYARAAAAARPEPPTLRSESLDIVLRFDLDPSLKDPAPGLGSHPQSIFNALNRAFPPSQGKRLFSGVRWTRNWNLIIQVEPGTGSTSFIIDKYASQIWNIIRPVLHFPAGHPIPAFDTGDAWHSVVFHNVPPLPERQAYDPLNIRQMLTAGGFRHTVKAFSVLCTDEELSRRHSERLPVPLRVTVNSREAAQELVDNGGLIMGGRYKATHYVPRRRQITSTPPALLTVPIGTAVKLHA